MRRPFVIALVAAIAFAVVAMLWTPIAPKRSTTQPAPQSIELPTLGRPNILLISLDTVRPNHLSCYGDRAFSDSPPTSLNIDKLASSPGGVRFATAAAQAPWTLPSHMSLFTSMLPSHNRVETISQILPEQFATLPEILHAHGYATAAIVNNGQMKSHWGFARGFDLWRELEVDTPAGNCESITTQAIDWLAGSASKEKPFLLFLHYYDAHDPYDPPAEFRKPFDVTISGEVARELAWRGRLPSAQLTPEQLTQLKNAYDGEIAWIDRELGKLFAKLPADTLVVLFSDHGEAFEEHGWTLHGATLFDEETRVLLLMHHPKLRSPASVAAPVALLDVAPTILGLCGIEPPPHFSGVDLRPLLAGQAHDPSRVILSETKAVLEGYALKSAALPPWKAVRDLVDGSTRVFKLPDESSDVAAKEPAIASALSKVLDAWAAEDDHWLIHAEGAGQFEVTLSSQGQFLVFIPAGIEPERDGLELSEDGKTLRWTTHPSPRRKSLYVQMSPADAKVQVALKIDGKPQPAEPSLRIVRHAGAGSAGVAARPGKLDEHTMRQLRSLGYVR